MHTLADYQLVWWVLIGAVLFLLALTMGFDLGVGALLPFFGSNETQRRVILNTIGGTWAGNQIWLVFGGGAIFAVWPRVYAMSFSGFYLAMLFFLWALFFRPITMEWRKKIDSVAWRSRLDWSLSICSGFVAFAIGLLLGNILQGVPFHYENQFHMIYAGNFWDLFNPFALLCGFISLSMLLTHGCTYLQMTADEVLAKKARQWAIVFAFLFVVGFACAGIWAYQFINGYELMKAASIDHPTMNEVNRIAQGLVHNYEDYPWMILAPLVGGLGSFISALGSKIKIAVIAFMGSSFMCLGAIGTVGFSLFPFIIPSSSHPAESLTIWNSSSSLYSLNALLWVVIIMLPLVLAYTFYVYSKMAHRILCREIESDGHSLY